MNVLKFCLSLFVSTSATFAIDRGTCRDNTLIDVFNTDLLDQCKDKCLNDDNCVAVTFNVELKVCQTFSVCTNPLKDWTGRCPNCITVLKEEFEPEICNFQGICQVRFCLFKNFSYLRPLRRFARFALKTSTPQIVNREIFFRFHDYLVLSFTTNFFRFFQFCFWNKYFAAKKFENF